MSKIILLFDSVLFGALCFVVVAHELDKPMPKRVNGEIVSFEEKGETIDRDHPRFEGLVSSYEQ